MLGTKRMILWPETSMALLTTCDLQLKNSTFFAIRLDASWIVLRGWCFGTAKIEAAQAPNWWVFLVAYPMLRGDHATFCRSFFSGHCNTNIPNSSFCCKIHFFLTNRLFSWWFAHVSLKKILRRPQRAPPWAPRCCCPTSRRMRRLNWTSCSFGWNFGRDLWVDGFFCFLRYGFLDGFLMNWKKWKKTWDKWQESEIWAP